MEKGSAPGFEFAPMTNASAASQRALISGSAVAASKVFSIGIGQAFSYVTAVSYRRFGPSGRPMALNRETAVFCTEESGHGSMTEGEDIDGITIGPVNADDPELAALVRSHLAHSYSTTPPENVFALDLNALFGLSLEVYGMWQDNTLIGMGALSGLGSDQGEIKSMHVAEAYRGRGHSRMMLRHLIDRACCHGMTVLKLETGSMEAYVPARRLYQSEGFAYCGPFGAYPDHPNSAFMQISLVHRG